MYFDFKITAWERVEVLDKDQEQLVLEAIKSGKITSSEDIFTFLEELDSGDNALFNVLDNTSKQMMPEENDGQCTIHVVDDEENEIWKNVPEDSKISIKKRLEYLRQELRAERISYGELIELESLKDHIDPEDVELLQASGVPEFPEETNEP